MSNDIQKIIDEMPDTIMLHDSEGNPLDPDGDNTFELSDVDKMVIASHMQEWGTTVEETINKMLERSLEKIRDEDVSS